MRKKRDHKPWWSLTHKSTQPEVELQFEYQNPDEALKDLAQGRDKREHRGFPAVPQDRPEDE